MWTLKSREGIYYLNTCMSITILRMVPVRLQFAGETNARLNWKLYLYSGRWHIPNITDNRPTRHHINQVSQHWLFHRIPKRISKCSIVLLEISVRSAVSDFFLLLLSKEEFITVQFQLQAPSITKYVWISFFEKVLLLKTGGWRGL